MSDTNPAKAPDRYLRMHDVERLTGLKKSTIYKAIKATPSTFPHPVRLSARAVAWRESELAEWQAQHKQGVAK